MQKHTFKHILAQLLCFLFIVEYFCFKVKCCHNTIPKDSTFVGGGGGLAALTFKTWLHCKKRLATFPSPAGMLLKFFFISYSNIFLWRVWNLPYSKKLLCNLVILWMFTPPPPPPIWSTKLLNVKLYCRELDWWGLPEENICSYPAAPSSSSYSYCTCTRYPIGHWPSARVIKRLSTAAYCCIVYLWRLNCFEKI